MIATVSVRNDQFSTLIKKLLTQVDRYGGDIQVLAYWDNFERPLGEIRQKLVEAADSSYVCFLDDDDDVPDYYCEKIYPRLNGVDYVGWRMQLYHDGQKMKPTYHSLKYTQWSEDDKGWYRNVSHLNPIKRELALKGDFTKSVPEDVDWATQVVPFVKTENYIEEPMYFYMHKTGESLWDKRNTPIVKPERPEVNDLYFKWLEIPDGNA